MRRLSMSAKLLIAATPLLAVLAALLGVMIRDNLQTVDDARRGAALGSTWEPLITTIRSMEAEQAVGIAGDDSGLPAARSATNESMVQLNNAVEATGDSDPLTFQVGQALNSIGLARAAVDATAAGSEQRDVAGTLAFDQAESSLVAFGRLLADEAGETQLSNELTAVAALAEVERSGSSLVQSVQRNLDRPPTLADFDEAQFIGRELDESVGLFQSVAPEAWITEFREAGFARAFDDAIRELEPLFLFDPLTDDTLPEVDLAPLSDTVAQIATFRDTLADDIVARSDVQAEEAQRSSMVQLAIVAGGVLLAALLAALVVRSITKRMRRVSAKAHEVADTQLPTLVEAMRDPRGRAALPTVSPIDDRGTDEVGELASAFDTVQATLVDVANEQVEILRRGVSDIFVTMARRNRSLVDRQLALLDELEAEVDDPDVLSSYYQLDHLATRMRRNSESLLVLANSESKRRRVKATEIDDVVRAAIGEVEDYRRVDVMNLDSLQVRGDVVADVSHLLAELIDNATAFSPPDSRVRVSGRHAGARYLVTVADEGVGIGSDRMAELNDLLAQPPVVGLSVEPTLGMSVVSLLANKHGIEVMLSAGSPGVIVEISLPSSIYGPIDDAESSPEPPPMLRSTTRDPDVLVEWIDPSPTGETFVATETPVDPGLVRSAPIAPVTPAPLRLDTPVDRTVETVETVAAAPEPASGVTERDHAGEPDVPATFAEQAFAPAAERVVDARPASAAATSDDELDLGSWDLTPAWMRDEVRAATPDSTTVDAPDETMSETSTETVTGTRSEMPVEMPVEVPVETQPVTNAAEEQPAPIAAQHLPPPPVTDPPMGEFDRPPAPPSFGAPTTLRPFVDPSARPAPSTSSPSSPSSRPAEPVVPTTLPASPATEATPTLPTRHRNGHGDGYGASNDASNGDGHDRAGASALAGPDRLAGQPGELPTRRPGQAFTSEPEPASPTQASKLDADAIRERLRSFQQEYRLGRSGDPGDAGSGAPSEQTSDRGVE